MLEKARLCFVKFNLKGEVQLGHLDNKHMLIRLKEIWYVDSFSMRIFRQTSNFHTDIESSIVPIWVSFPHLLLFLFNKKFLFSLAHMIGTPLTFELTTAERTRPSCAKVCVQIDLLKKLPFRIGLECGDSILGCWQSIEYDNLPKYR